jgi:hypothetical protein
MNKRADFSVTLLVILTVVLCGAALYAFLMHNRADKEVIFDKGEIFQFYEENRIFDFYLTELAREVIREMKDKKVEINKEKFLLELKKNYFAYEVKEDYPFKEYIIGEEQFEASFDQGIMILRIKNFERNKILDLKSDIKEIGQVRNISINIKI